MKRYLFALLAVTALALPARVVQAQDQVQDQSLAARYAVRALGVKVGEIALSGSLGPRRYTASAQLRTTGLAGVVRRVHFLLSASGARQGARFAPERYDEDMDTGRRQSQASLRFAGGVARVSGAGTGAVPPAQHRGAVDPLTALVMVLRDQPAEGLCRVRQRVYDGERLSEVVLQERQARNGQVVCSGRFRRLAGYTPEEMAERRQFDLRLTYVPAGGAMRAVRARVQTIYGPADLVRR